MNIRTAAFVLAAMTGAVSPSLAGDVDEHGRLIIGGNPRTWGVGAGKMDTGLNHKGARPPSVISKETMGSTPVVRRVHSRSPYRRADRGIVSDGAGLTVAGSYADDNLSIRFQLGGGTRVVRERAVCDDGERDRSEPFVIHRPIVYAWPYYGASRYWSSSLYGGGAVFTDVINQAPAYQSPTPQPPVQKATGEPTAVPQQVEEVDSLEMGVLLLQSGDARRAAGALRRHLAQHPDDARAMRTLAMAMLEDKDLDNAAGLMRAAYRTDPRLASDPLAPEALGYGGAEFRGLLLRSVGYAHRVNTASSWMLVASLMHAEGRTGNAMRMLDNARELGLERVIYDAMVVELRR